MVQAKPEQFRPVEAGREAAEEAAGGGGACRGRETCRVGGGAGGGRAQVVIDVTPSLLRSGRRSPLPDTDPPLSHVPSSAALCPRSFLALEERREPSMTKKNLRFFEKNGAFFLAQEEEDPLRELADLPSAREWLFNARSSRARLISRTNDVAEEFDQIASAGEEASSREVVEHAFRVLIVLAVLLRRLGARDDSCRIWRRIGLDPKYGLRELSLATTREEGGLGEAPPALQLRGDGKIRSARGCSLGERALRRVAAFKTAAALHGDDGESCGDVGDLLDILESGLPDEAHTCAVDTEGMADAACDRCHRIGLLPPRGASASLLGNRGGAPVA
jgi:hypothetical protein